MSLVSVKKGKQCYREYGLYGREIIFSEVNQILFSTFVAFLCCVVLGALALYSCMYNIAILQYYNTIVCTIEQFVFSC